ncbi:hypothetical protein E2C01_085633 [Portunus trituberculatus]|uniref:Uncharacterized protein n=1 Tax=Portunus trituberculatus TaxID=210409 RepID=A0A5B7J9F4_PORTR|nr:hypothetical protein [Portunus trituberculatus]
MDQTTPHRGPDQLLSSAVREDKWPGDASRGHIHAGMFDAKLDPSRHLRFGSQWRYVLNIYYFGNQ